MVNCSNVCTCMYSLPVETIAFELGLGQDLGIRLLIGFFGVQDWDLRNDMDILS